MRLIASPTFRAFPELDAFSDEQCRGFVRATRRRARERAVAWAFRFLVTFAVPPAVILATGSLRASSGTTRSFDILVALVIAGVVWIGIAWLVSRDLALRWLIRRVMRRSGSCVDCGYRLVGLPVGRDCVVTCPECGQALDLSAFPQCRVATADGTERFLPAGGFVIEAAPWWTPARRRALGRLGATAALAVVIPSAAWVAFNAYETGRARSDRALLPNAARLCDALVAGTASVADRNAFDVHGVAQRNDGFVFGLTKAVQTLMSDGLDARYARWGASTVEPVPGGGAAIGTANAAAAAAVIDDEVEDSIALQGGFREFIAPVRSPYMRPEPHVLLVRDVPGIVDGIPFSCGPQLRAVGCAAALAATRAGDCGRLVEAVELLLAAARVDRWAVAGGAWADDVIPSIELVPLVASAVRGCGEAFGAEVDAAIVRQGDGPDASAMARVRLDFYRACLCRIYIDSFALRTFPWATAQSRTIFRSSTVPFPWPWLSSYAGSRATLDRAGADALREALKEPSERDDMALVRACADLAAAGPGIAFAGGAIQNGTRFADRELTFVRALRTAVAIERFRLAEGRLPARLEELVPRWLPALPKDPHGDGPFAYSTGPDDRTDGFGYSLRSVPAAGAASSPAPDSPSTAAPGPAADGASPAGSAVFPPN